MTEAFVPLLADYGVWLVALVTFLSCLALPVPSSLVMLTAGAFAASGDLDLSSVMVAAFAGAILGDNTGYALTRKGGARLERWLNGNASRRALMSKAGAYMARWGGISVFLSRWLVSPLGPYVNYASGLTAMSWPRFALWGAAGEAVWVGLYVTLGYVFAANLAAIAALLGNLSGFAAGLVVVAVLGWLLLHRMPRRRGLAQN